MAPKLRSKGGEGHSKGTQSRINRTASIMAEEPKESPAFQQMDLNVNKIQRQMDQMRDMFLTAMANRDPVKPAPVPFPVANAPPAVDSLLVPTSTVISKKFLQRSSLHQDGKSTKRI